MRVPGPPHTSQLESIVPDVAMLKPDVRSIGPAGLVEEHYQTVYRYAYRLCGCAATAEDLTQETFLHGLPHLDQLRTDNVRGWLLAIARRAFMRWLRKTVHPQHGRMRELDAQLSEDGLSMDSVLMDLKEPAQSIARVDAADSLQTALEQLGNDARVILLMYYFEDLSYAQIAAQLDIPLGTVMSRLNRGREQLRRVLDAESSHDSSQRASHLAGTASHIVGTATHRPTREAHHDG